MSMRESVLVMMFLFSIFFVFFVAVTFFPILIPIIIIIGVVVGLITGWEFGGRYEDEVEDEDEVVNDDYSGLSEEEQQIIKDIMRKNRDE